MSNLLQILFYNLKLYYFNELNYKGGINMNHLYDRGWFRLALYNANTEGELIHLISVLRQKLYDTKDDEMFNSLSDEEKQKLLDTIKTSINVCWVTQYPLY